MAFDQSMLDSVRNVTGTVSPASADQIEKELATTRDNVRRLAVKVGELHKVISQNLNPATELVSPGTPRTRVFRALSLKLVIIVGILFVLIALVVAAVLSIFHSRVREGEAEEAAMAQAESA